MDVYGSMVGATPAETAAITETKGGVRYLKVDAAKALLLILGNWYPSMAFEAVRVINGQAVISQGFDPEADAFLFKTVGGKDPNYQSESVFQQIRTAVVQNPKVVIVINQEAAADILNGKTGIEWQTYGIAQDIDRAKKLLAASNFAPTAAIVPPEALSSVLSGDSGAGAKPEKKFSIITPLIGAGIGLLVGGPGGAAVGAGIGVGIEVLRAA